MNRLKMLKSFFKVSNVLAFCLTMVLPGLVQAQTKYPIDLNQDILHYTFSLNLSDGSEEIKGRAKIVFTLKAKKNLVLDFIGLKADGKGMVVEKVMMKDSPLPFVHEQDRLSITFNNNPEPESPGEITIYYYGIPAAGLVMGNNKFGEPVFFGDNYPDRARNWLPCVDHPADKATVTWIITAPDYYKVVASGKFISEIEEKENTITTTWDEQVPLSTKVMTFGAANFAVDHSGDVNGAPVTTWVYEKNKEAGFFDFAIAPDVLAYFDSLIGRYPYEKLANVQSKTTYGGMENAGNIFYFEESVNGKGERETLIAHEIVHQWFGNSATEKDWPHAWLSEGFATYLTNVYVGSRYGQQQMDQRLIASRKNIIKYWHEHPLPIVNRDLVTYPRVSNLAELLNTNTYQKAGWVLHMLRNELGDDFFWQGLRKYYADYKDAIAGTADFQQVMEEVSDKDLQFFFNQWLYGKGQPVLDASWQYSNNNVVVDIIQKQESPFIFPLEIGLVYGEEVIIKSVDINSSKESFNFSNARPDRVILDPKSKLLFEGEVLLKQK